MKTWWCLFCLLLVSCSEAPDVQLVTGPTMGSHYSVKIADMPATQSIENLKTDIQALLDGIEQVASTWKPDSELSRFNQSPPGSFAASHTLRMLVAVSLRACKETEGALDVTVGPLVNLWGFGPEAVPEHRPSPAQIQQAGSRVGCQHLFLEERSVLEENRIVKAADVYVDLSSVTQGFAGERVAELLDARGIKNYLVDLSGELISKGKKPDGSPWRIAVEVPVMGKLFPGGGMESVQKIVTLKGMAIATSGDYRNFLEIDDTVVNHIIDPLTGLPVEHRLASVTVLDHSLTWADAMSTALMVMGPEKGYAFASARQMPVLFVVRAENGFAEKMTPEFAAYVSEPVE